MYSLWFWFVLMSRLFVKATKLLMWAYSCISRSTPVMLGIYISIFVILANILFICAIYSCIKVNVRVRTHTWIVRSSLFSAPLLKLFPAAMQTVSKKIVQSRTNSTLVGVFSIILVFISAFVNMVSDGHTETERQRHLVASLGNKSTHYRVVASGKSAD